ncbi:MAG: cysteine hydrolase [Desulfuromonadaceae bacterium]|nr:cysteine hydrolase [Desulfuromonadaceae bacterium]
MTYLLLFFGIILFFAAMAGLTMYRSMFVATRGKKIHAYQAPRKALLVLDLQEGYGGTNSLQPATAPPEGGLLATVNSLIAMAVETDMEVVYVRQVFSNNLFVRLHGGRRVSRVIVDRRITRINDNDFEKNRTDAFSCRDLERFLIEHQVDELYLTGVDAAYCVYYTALGAKNRGYAVSVVLDAVATRSDMNKLMERYRRKEIGVITSSELLQLASERKQDDKYT